MQPVWYFRSRDRAETNQAPIEADLFSREGQGAISALVRETLQNSLDARNPASGEPVEVLFRMSRAEERLSGDAIERWFGSLRPFFRSAGLVDQCESLTRPISYLTIEDRNTTGLCGKIDAASEKELPDRPRSTQSFYYFWRNVGITGKGESSLGSHGLGKAVFMRSSALRCMFGWTIRQDDRRSLLMGQALAEKTFEHDGKTRDPRGHFGLFGEDQVAMPTDAPEDIEAFRKAFGLRRSVEPGFSVVIPEPVEELGDRIYWNLAAAVLEHFTLPILKGHLRVTVDVPPSPRWKIDASNVDVILGKLTEEATDLDVAARLRSLVHLARWTLESPRRVETVRGAGHAAPKWAEVKLADTDLVAVRESWQAHRPVLVRVHLTVRPKKESTLSTWFDVAMHRDDSVKGSAAHFVRQGLSIPNRLAVLGGSGVTALVIVDDKPLADMLRLAEEAAHTTWGERESKLLERYVGANDRVKFVRAAPAAMLRILTEADKALDKSFLADLFPTPTEAGEKGPGRQKQATRAGDPPTVPPMPPPEPQPLSVRQVAGGFIVTRNALVPILANQAKIVVAYDSAEGDPFTRWEPYDFDLADKELAVSVKGGTIISRKGKELEVADIGPDFTLQVTGFDEDRDLVVRVPSQRKKPPVVDDLEETEHDHSETSSEEARPRE